jgi:DnaJ-class molecular chaperone
MAWFRPVIRSLKSALILVLPSRCSHKRLFRVSVPSGIKAGSKLRLKGLGKEVESNDRPERGNLYLKVRIQSGMSNDD